MPAGWDQWLVYLIVAAAALYVLSGTLRRKGSACGGGTCGGCSAQRSEAPVKSELIQIEPAPPRNRAGGEP